MVDKPENQTKTNTLKRAKKDYLDQRLTVIAT